jgi:hypothetical protein
LRLSWWDADSRGFKPPRSRAQRQKWPILSLTILVKAAPCPLVERMEGSLTQAWSEGRDSVRARAMTALARVLQGRTERTCSSVRLLPFRARRIHLGQEILGKLLHWSWNLDDFLQHFPRLRNFVQLGVSETETIHGNGTLLIV